MIFTSLPLILASLGATFSEFAGCLAIFLDGIMNLCGFFTYAFTVFTGSLFAGSIISLTICTGLTALCSWAVFKWKMNPFLSATALNLFFGSLISFFSNMFFGTRGVLTSQGFHFPSYAKILLILITMLLLAASWFFLFKTKAGLYLRISGSDADVLESRGVNVDLCRILAWTLAAIFAGLSGICLLLKVGSFVPNLSAGRGWIALAAVFMGRKNLFKVSLSVILFCILDYITIALPGFTQALPNGVLLALPYIVCLAVSAFGSKSSS